MMDFRPVGYVIGWLVACLGAAMLVPAGLDLVDGQGHWRPFLQSSLITMLSGGLIALASSNGVKEGLTIQQSFLLATGVWVVLPAFGALPFMLGITQTSFTDAYFESMSGLTTTGSTILSGLDFLPRGILIWRGILQWLGGIGIIVVAMVFLPEMRVGGMQLFRSEGFDTMGKILPRASQIAQQVSVVYVGLTALCALAYALGGMSTFDAITHSMTTIATGGFANYDSSLGHFGPGIEYIASVFMLLAALPFVLFVKALIGSPDALWKDSQVQVFFMVTAVIVLILSFWHWADFNDPMAAEVPFREILFNVVSILTGTGYATADYTTWGAFPITIFFFVGLIGGCAGSATCSIKIFRFQLLFASIVSQIKQVHAPHGVFQPHFRGKVVDDETQSSVMAFFTFFVVTLGALAVALSLTGLDFVTALSGAATAIANVGPGLGDIIGPSGNFAPLNDASKWILTVGMLLGRLELVSVYVLFTARFWRG